MDFISFLSKHVAQQGLKSFLVRKQRLVIVILTKGPLSMITLDLGKNKIKCYLQKKDVKEGQ